jgi:hypothetical protein
MPWHGMPAEHTPHMCLYRMTTVTSWNSYSVLIPAFPPFHPSGSRYRARRSYAYGRPSSCKVIVSSSMTSNRYVHYDIIMVMLHGLRPAKPPHRSKLFCCAHTSISVHKVHKNNFAQLVTTTRTQCCSKWRCWVVADVATEHHASTASAPCAASDAATTFCTALAATPATTCSALGTAAAASTATAGPATGAAPVLLLLLPLLPGRATTVGAGGGGGRQGASLLPGS